MELRIDLSKELFGSINKLYVDTICPNISKYDDYQYRFRSGISTFDFVELKEYIGDPKMVASILIKYCLSLWFDDFNLTVSDLEKRFTKIFFSVYDSSDKDMLDISTGSFIRLVESVNKLTGLINTAEYVVPNLDFYVPIGKIKRSSYRSMIDLILVDKNQKVKVILIGPKVPIEKSLKVHAALDYLSEAGFCVSEVYYLNYNPKSYSKDIVLDRITVTNLISQISKNFKNISLQQSPNLGFCPMCPYREHCNVRDMIGS